ncbi:hypothetical protein P4O66_010763 [Electrophorus voltai]|uniref:Uncharacterized protein n=1 Tax=Electrophorus voltai TaxID=2609070 RepID=A0AAD8Z8E8_9TELE|nr:hypothetical protein P4O66_010763 [Electrophorus voltai]
MYAERIQGLRAAEEKQCFEGYVSCLLLNSLQGTHTFWLQITECGRRVSRRSARAQHATFGVTSAASYACVPSTEMKIGAAQIELSRLNVGCLQTVDDVIAGPSVSLKLPSPCRYAPGTPVLRFSAGFRPYSCLDGFPYRQNLNTEPEEDQCHY